MRGVARRGDDAGEPLLLSADGLPDGPDSFFHDVLLLLRLLPVPTLCLDDRRDRDAILSSEPADEREQPVRLLCVAVITLEQPSRDDDSV